MLTDPVGRMVVTPVMTGTPETHTALAAELRGRLIG